MTLAQADVRDERQEKRPFSPAVSRQFATSEAVQSSGDIVNELIARLGVFLFYGVLFGISGWHLYRLIMAVIH
jgi:hypothetical protein